MNKSQKEDAQRFVNNLVKEFEKVDKEIMKPNRYLLESEIMLSLLAHGKKHKKTDVIKIADAIEETIEVAKECQVSVDELIDLFITFKTKS